MHGKYVRASLCYFEGLKGASNPETTAKTYRYEIVYAYEYIIVLNTKNVLYNKYIWDSRVQHLLQNHREAFCYI